MREWLGIIMLLLMMVAPAIFAQEAQPLIPIAPERSILDVAWSPDGDMIATIDDGGTLNITSSDQITPIFQFTQSITLVEAVVEWNPQGDYLAAGIGNSVFIWDSEHWELLHQFVAGDPDGVIPYYETEIPEGIVNIRWSADSHYVVAGSSSYITTVWDNQEAQAIYQVPDRSGGGPGRVWLNDDGWLSDGRSKLNVFTEEIVRPRPAENPHIFGGSAEGGTTEPRPDNTQIAWGTAYGILGIIDLDDLNTIQGIQVTVNDPSTPARGIVDISWDGTWDFIAAASRDGELYVVNLAAGEVTSILNVDGQLNAVDWNPQTNQIIYAGVSENGQPILSIVDVSGIGGVPSGTPTPTFTPTLTYTPTATETLTPTLTPTTTFTPTFTPTPSPICTITVAAGDVLGLVNAINAANNNGDSPDSICSVTYSGVLT